MRSVTGSYAGGAAAYRASRRLVQRGSGGRGPDHAQAGPRPGMARTATPSALRWITKGLGLLDGRRGVRRGPAPGRPARAGTGASARRPATTPGRSRWCTRAVAEAEAAGELVGPGRGALRPRLGQHGTRPARTSRATGCGPSPSTRSSATSRAVERHQHPRHVRLLEGGLARRREFYRRGWPSNQRTGNPIEGRSSSTTSARSTWTRGVSTRPRSGSAGGAREWRARRLPLGGGSAAAMLARVAAGEASSPRRCGCVTRRSPSSGPSAARSRRSRPRPVWPSAWCCPGRQILVQHACAAERLWCAARFPCNNRYTFVHGLDKRPGDHLRARSRTRKTSATS